VHNQLTEHFHSIGHEAEHVGEKLGIVHGHEGGKQHTGNRRAHTAEVGKSSSAEGQASTSAQPQASNSKSSDDEIETPEPPAIVGEDEDEDDRSRSQHRGLRDHVRDRLFGRPRASTDRTHGHARTGSGGAIPRDPAARLRADSVRDSRRDVSPARSIRFVGDRPGSSGALETGTPSSVTPPGAGGIGPNGGLSSETPGTRVMFDLPTQRPK
jgi:hypothetical protein